MRNIHGQLIKDYLLYRIKICKYGADSYLHWLPDWKIKEGVRFDCCSKENASILTGTSVYGLMQYESLAVDWDKVFIEPVEDDE